MQQSIFNHQPKNSGTCLSDTVIIYSWSFKQLSIVINQKSLVPWCSGTVFYLGVSHDWEFSSTEIFEINMCLVYALDTVSVLIISLG